MGVVQEADEWVWSRKWTRGTHVACSGWQGGCAGGVSPGKSLAVCVFSPCSLKEKVLFILQATFQHARNLAFFTAVYRTLTAVLAWGMGGARQWHTFVAAFASGYLVFGREDKVNTQVSQAGELPAVE